MTQNWEQDKRTLGSNWTEDMSWNLVKRNVWLAKLRLFKVYRAGKSSKEIRAIWHEIEGEGEKQVIATLKKGAMEWIDQALKRERQEGLLKDRNYDYRTALDACYDEEISNEERAQIWRSLNKILTMKVIAEYKYFSRIPWPKSWNRLKKKPLRFSREQKESIEEAWESCSTVLWGVVDRHAEIRRETFDEYWGDKENAVLVELAKRLQEFRDQNDRLTKIPISDVKTLRKKTKSQIRSWKKDWDESETRWQLAFEPRRIELEAKRERMLRASDNVPWCLKKKWEEEWTEVNRQRKEHAEKTKAKLEEIAQDFAERKREYEEQLAFYDECLAWVEQAPVKRMCVY
jgi:hypothetical protein